MSRVDEGVALREMIRTDILAGHFLPRERLVEADLVTRYGHARSAVRTALTSLVADGLVEHERNRGARVRQVTTDEVLQVLRIRQPLQALCVQMAALNGLDHEKAELPAMVEQLGIAVDDNNADELFEANQAIRRHMRRMARQPILTQMLEQLEARNALRFYPHTLPSRRRESFHEQSTMIEAVIRGDAVGARDAEFVRMQHAIDALLALDADADPQRVTALD